MEERCVRWDAVWDCGMVGWCWLCLGYVVAEAVHTGTKATWDGHGHAGANAKWRCNPEGATWRPH
jgi:hypothetical protein